MPEDIFSQFSSWEPIEEEEIKKNPLESYSSFEPIVESPEEQEQLNPAKNLISQTVSRETFKHGLPPGAAMFLPRREEDISTGSAEKRYRRSGAPLSKA